MSLLKGSDSVYSEADLNAKLSKGRPLIVKAGFDPTAPDIHLGHTVVLRKLKQFQLHGHQVVVVIGDFTALLGDPSGRSKTRPQLTKDQVEAHAKTYLNQVFKILDRDKTTIRFNSEWFGKFSAQELITLAASTTVARMLERDDFQKRLTTNLPIGVHEFLYPLLQAHDSVVLKADVELGGTDQVFNLLLGRKLMQDQGLEPQVCITMPLLVGLDGVQKMSKSLDNYIGVDESPNDIFGKIMSMPDALMPTYYTLLTEKVMLDDHPRKLKCDLAMEIVTQYHDEESAKQAQEHFDKLFVRKELPAEMQEFEVETSTVWLPKLLVDLGFAPSNSEGRRLIKHGGVKIDGTPVNLEEHIFVSREAVLQCGKRRFVKIKVAAH